MKALSLTQPMAWAVFHGKDIENRKWSTKFRGRVLIHASKTFNHAHYRWLVDNDNRLVTGGVPEEWNFVFGAILGEVDIIDCVTHHGSKWFFGPYGFVLANPVPFAEPVPYKGQLGFFDVPDEIVKGACRIPGNNISKTAAAKISEKLW